jgi:hypothetical protein
VERKQNPPFISRPARRVTPALRAGSAGSRNRASAWRAMNTASAGAISPHATAARTVASTCRKSSTVRNDDRSILRRAAGSMGASGGNSCAARGRNRCRLRSIRSASACALSGRAARSGTRRLGGAARRRLQHRRLRHRGGTAQAGGAAPPFAGRDYDTIEKTCIQPWLLARDDTAVAAKRERLAARGPLRGFAGTVNEAIDLIGQYQDAGIDPLINADGGTTWRPANSSPPTSCRTSRDEGFVGTPASCGIHPRFPQRPEWAEEAVWSLCNPAPRWGGIGATAASRRCDISVIRIFAPRPHAQIRDPELQE